jgi:hypothetical protein
MDLPKYITWKVDLQHGKLTPIPQPNKAGLMTNGTTISDQSHPFRKSSTLILQKKVS